MDMIIVFIVVGIMAAALLSLARKKSKTSDIKIPESPQRAGYVGYYGTSGNQVEETKDHVNLLWECFWDGIEQAIENIKLAQMATVIDINNYILEPPQEPNYPPRGLRPDAEESLRLLLDTLRAQGVLQYVKFITPTDEPNLPENNSIDAMPAAFELINKVVKDYEELEGVKTWLMYYSDNEMQHIGLADVVSFNKYEAKSSIFKPGGLFDQVEARLRPDQQMAIIPGATYGQDPESFLNLFNARSRVIAIVSFLWRDPHDNKGFDGIVGMDKVRPKYEALGRTIVNAE